MTDFRIAGAYLVAKWIFSTSFSSLKWFVAGGSAVHTVPWYVFVDMHSFDFLNQTNGWSASSVPGTWWN